MKEIEIVVLVLGLMGFLFSLLLAFLSKKLKVEEDSRVEKIIGILPGINCGACGFSGCAAFAQAVVKNSKIFSGCLPGGPQVNKEIGALIGVSEVANVQNKALICHCGACDKEKLTSTLYQGPLTCAAAHISGGALDCSWGCLGLGDCAMACPTGALVVKERKVYIDYAKCINCGKCLRECPRNLFELIPVEKNKPIYYVACNSKEKAPVVKKACSKGCIGCGICVKLPGSPFYLSENISYIAYQKIPSPEIMEDARNRCPTECIIKVDSPFRKSES
ncbi:MAG: RnfABCDGE type electron transport complex subunit B [Candidatus Omnitrophica bacterium]|nr:RnfABCDGE type electron transport complex subunit B [Candidatus Omnitrophota bacterium]MDD5429767.1 RnfABCDGE type electron transport complex subunit B [Candidatus Omnitrophota bacterium]